MLLLPNTNILPLFTFATPVLLVAFVLIVFRFLVFSRLYCSIQFLRFATFPALSSLISLAAILGVRMFAIVQYKQTNKQTVEMIRLGAHA